MSTDNKSSILKNFAIGGLSAMTATSVIQPIDMVKVRIQLKSEARGGNLSPFVIAKDIYRNEGGMKGFYKGLDSALLRQAVYATLRLGIYFNLSDYIKNNTNNGANLTSFQKVYCSLTAGAIGSFIGNPCDLTLVRMQADSTLPEAERRNYKNVVDALKRIVSEEGVTSLWNGASPTIMRAMALNMAQLVTYDEAKEKLTKKWGKGHEKLVMFSASMISAVASSTASLPFDNIKTKLQKMKRLPDGTLPYTGFIDCAKKTVANEGVLAFWTGLPTYYFRVGPHSIITLLTAEFLRTLMF
jgi:solute carrier family 25 oxoglutarate transporter 11